MNRRLVLECGLVGVFLVSGQRSLALIQPVAAVSRASFAWLGKIPNRSNLRSIRLPQFELLDFSIQYGSSNRSTISGWLDSSRLSC